MTETRRAVVIDDEPDLCAYIQSILEEHGFAVRTANDAKGGEQLIRADPPDLICLDLMMPGRSGVNFFGRLRGDDATSSIPIIMVTGIKEKLNIDWSEIASGLKARQPDGVVEKPIDPVRLMRVVEEVLEHGETGAQPG
ncbi:MAG: response regulator [Planctomycetota bacterium]|jgi:DNA-binding response OmpR family regulator